MRWAWKAVRCMALPGTPARTLGKVELQREERGVGEEGIICGKPESGQGLTSMVTFSRKSEATDWLKGQCLWLHDYQDYPLISDFQLQGFCPREIMAVANLLWESESSVLTTCRTLYSSKPVTLSELQYLDKGKTWCDLRFWMNSWQG